MKLILLDRDGVINKDPQKKLYVTKWVDFHFLPGAISAIKRLNKAGFKIAVISNQAGVAKGLFSKTDLNLVTKKMLAKIKARGGGIKKVYYCLHRNEDNCCCRKPKTGLLKKAVSYFNAFPRQIFFIGDSRFDVEAGHKFGCKTILVLSGKSRLKDIKNWPVRPDYVTKDLNSAVDLVVTN